MVDIYTEELINLHRGQGKLLSTQFWDRGLFSKAWPIWQAWSFFGETRSRVRHKKSMSKWWTIVSDKKLVELLCPFDIWYLFVLETGGLLRLGVKLMQEASNSDKWVKRAQFMLLLLFPFVLICRFLCSSRDYTPLVNKIGIHFQVRDDYMNLQSKQVCPFFIFKILYDPILNVMWTLYTTVHGQQGILRRLHWRKIFISCHTLNPRRSLQPTVVEYTKAEVDIGGIKAIWSAGAWENKHL